MRRPSLTFKGRRPLLALWLKFLRNNPIQNDSELRLLDFETLNQIQNETQYFKQQRITKHTREESHLLQKSGLGFWPHEVYQVKIVNEQNIAFVSRVFHGSQLKASSLRELEKLIHQMVFKARQEGLVVTEIELRHTHPSLELLVTPAGSRQSSFIFNGLSQADDRCGALLAEFLHYPLTLKAITPAASYSKTY